jgi:hypothetical protein
MKRPSVVRPESSSLVRDYDLDAKAPLELNGEQFCARVVFESERHGEVLAQPPEFDYHEFALGSVDEAFGT